MSETAPSTPALPPLYHGFEAVTAERHGQLRLKDVGYGFASRISAIPLAAEEFVVAARTLPIVFAAQPPHMPVAITGLASGVNLHVTPEGTWRAGIYVPAYVRRYPFFLLRVAEGSDDLALCVDPQAAQLVKVGGAEMFTEEGKPAPQLERAFAFTRAVEEAMLKTRTMAQGLAELGLLRPSEVTFDQGGRPVRVDGFFAVERPALAALPAEKLAELRDRGWLEAVYAHLLSIGGLPELARELPAA
ncbi:MAG TPA: SapC family protein [Crenalkalicoccus sp.]|nr:SapC family protein [Crenalkalicoccus sp.]